MAVQLFQIIGNLPQLLESVGIYAYIFPFLLSLAIVYGVLQYSLGDKIKQKSILGLISLIIAFFVMLYSSWNLMIVQFFAYMGGSLLLVATGILIIIIFLGLFGIKPDHIMMEGGTGSKISKAGWAFILILMFIGVMIFFGVGGGFLVPIGTLSSDLQAAIIVIIIIALAMYWMTSGGDGEAPKKE